MDIHVKNAYSNNLKNISISIPNLAITAFTGVSGSGKSTLLKNVLAAYGARNLTLISSKTVKDALMICDDIKVEKIENLPNTILIDVNSSVTNPTSTVSTLSGIHELVRNLFSEFGESHCKNCGSPIKYNFYNIKELFADFKVDKLFKQAIEYIESNGKIINIDYYDKNLKSTNIDKKKVFATIKFSLNKVSEKILHDFNLSYNIRIYTKVMKTGVIYDVLREVECNTCHVVNPNLSRSRLSFNTKYTDGGGACRCCGGSGFVVKLNEKFLFQDTTKGILSGASTFVTAKGVKYTNITEKFLIAIYNKLGLDINTSIDNISKDKLHKILYGIDEKITFTDRIGGNKKIKYDGLVNYLSESYKVKKGIRVLSDLFDSIQCSECNGTRIDSNISCFTFKSKTIKDILNMTLEEMGEWCKNIINDVSGKAKIYLERIIGETDNFNKISCGHLTLSRASNTLSGGELQRIRICMLLNSNINGLCYLLDEPSSGLHYSDIEKLGKLFRFLCNKGNTIIMVEHNKKLLQYCDYIVDMGPSGGCSGGNILFSDYFNKIGKYDTDTVKSLLNINKNTKKIALEKINLTNYIEFNNLSYNNLKDVSVKFPRNAFTVICGVSGSGKTTFVRRAVYDNVIREPKKYGFDGIKYLAQASTFKSNSSTVATILKIGTYIAKLYEKSSKIKSSYFLPGSLDGKCSACMGRGYIYSEFDEPIGICEQCNGSGYEERVLSVKVNNLNIAQLYNTNLEELKNVVKDEKLKSIIEAACELDVGYLSLSRSTKTLSKGELQRVSLIPILVGKEKRQLIILDEPSKGLHSIDSEKLIYAMHKVVLNENTLLVVEHNPDLIQNADYIIEFGGTGVNGGYVLFQGKPDEIKNTPTAIMLEGVGESCKIEKQNIISNIIIHTDEEIIEYEPFNLFYDKKNENTLLKIAKKSRDDFWAVAIPNNIMFSRASENMIQAKTPFIQTIDFKEKVKYDISIAEAIGISELLKKIVSNNGSEIMKYVFDVKSTTGKCTTCEGKGQVFTVPIEYFIEDGKMTIECKKFLRNSTEYMLIAKLLKKEHIDITKDFKEMSKEEQQIFLWGYDTIYEIDGKPRCWKGIVNNFIKQHKYYPEKHSENVFNNRHKILCPICKGEMLKQKFNDYRCNALSYKEWMSLSISDILNKIQISDHNINENNDLVLALQVLKSIGVGELKLSYSLVSMDSVLAEKIRFISLFLNKIYGMGIVIKNMDILDIEDKKIIKDLAKKCSETNTLWII